MADIAGDVDRILERAAELAGGATPPSRRFVLGCLFLTPSMRTRAGFQVAAARLGGSTVSIDELRVDGAMSSAESFDDALRVVAGMTDVMVTRTPSAVAPETLALAGCPVINGGDSLEHPTQGLIDLAAVQRLRGDVRRLRVGLCGDLGMRAATSLLRLLGERPPASLTLIHPDGRGPRLPGPLEPLATRAELSACAELDVLVMVGLPPGSGAAHLDAESRRPYILDSALVATMSTEAVVLSPMPVIDEISAGAKSDVRVRIFQQSDYATFVRMAVLEMVLGW